MSTPYVVKAGDTLSNIARRNGNLNWQQIYYHPDKNSFRRRRPNPDLIYPGDILMIPDGNPLPTTKESLAKSTAEVPRTAGNVNIHRDVLPYLDYAYMKELALPLPRPALTDDQLRILGAWSSAETSVGKKLFNNNFTNAKEYDLSRPHFTIVTEEVMPESAAETYVKKGWGTIKNVEPDGRMRVVVTSGPETKFKSFATPDEGASWVVRRLFREKDGDGKVTAALFKTDPAEFGFVVGPRWATESPVKYSAGIRDHFKFHFKDKPISRSMFVVSVKF
jgi:LysM repeat protein